MIRDRLSPNTKFAINEVGIMCPDDADGFSPLLYNAGASVFIYTYLRLMSSHGINSLHQSQLVAYPGYLGLDSQNPAVAMLDYRTGEGTAKWWALALLRQEIVVNARGESDAAAIEMDARIRAGSFATAENAIFIQWVNTSTTLKCFLINMHSATHSISILDAAGSPYRLIDETTGNEPAKAGILDVDLITLRQFAIMVVHYDVHTKVSADAERNLATEADVEDDAAAPLIEEAQVDAGIALE
jgi:hypothetical protein